MSSPAVVIENLCKSYDAVRAVDNLSLSVAEGEIFGLIGPDGAGKTTTMRILCGLLSYDSGRCSVFGFDVAQQIGKIKEIVGYMPQRFSLYPDLTVEENLRFFADLFQVSREAREQRLEQLLNFSKLQPFQKRRAQDLSGGMKQKLALSCTLIHTPRILILDEPTTGVDPVSRREFWRILRNLRQQGVTILVSTPYMDETHHCDRVAFMHQGKTLAIGVPQSMARLFPYQLLEVQCSPLSAAARELRTLEGILAVQVFGDKLHVSIQDAAAMKHAIHSFLSSKKIEIVAIQEVSPSIEDTFIELMRR